MGHAARHLELSGSKLAELPADVGSLGALRALEVQYCDLVALPESIGELRLLRSLCAAEPAPISLCSALPRRFQIRGNPTPSKRSY